MIRVETTEEPGVTVQSGPLCATSCGCPASRHTLGKRRNVKKNKGLELKPKGASLHPPPLHPRGLKSKLGCWYKLVSFQEAVLRAPPACQGSFISALSGILSPLCHSPETSGLSPNGVSHLSCAKPHPCHMDQAGALVSSREGLRPTLYQGQEGTCSRSQGEGVEVSGLESSRLLLPASHSQRFWGSWPMRPWGEPYDQKLSFFSASEKLRSYHSTRVFFS